MAHNWKQPYQPEFQHLSTNHSNSPAAPYNGGDTPITFRTNVNRAKTKRWVEAKQYSYDGNDWGDDDEEEDDDIPPPPSHPNNVTHAQSREQTVPGHDGTGHGRSAERPGETSPTTPIVRPVDIYKRMRDGPPGSAESPSASVGPSATGPKSSNNPPPGPDVNSDDHTRLHPQDPATGPSPIPLQSRTTPILALPDVKRLSGFGSDFMSNSAPAPAPAPAPAESQPSTLHHNPSLGFRSVVHQAFDVETPSTAVESMTRSNSASTSAISPIMPPRTTSDTRTPTITEEPGEGLSTPTDPVPGFKPGHRRDLSVPSPGNSPSRTPMITTADTRAQPAAAEMSPSTPFGSPLDPTAPRHPPIAESTSSPLAEKDRPAPLNIGSLATNQHNSTPEVPIIVPSSSTETSPQDVRNDRLHQEIIQSLSRENTPSDDPQSRPQTGRPDNQPNSPPDSLIPSEYERYWTEGLPTSPQDSRPNDSGAAPAAQEEPRPRLARRFSWESSTSSGEDVPPAADAPPTVDAQSPPVGPIPGQFPAGPADDSPPPAAAAAPAPSTPPEAEERPPVEKPKLTIIPPSATDAGSVHSERPPEMVHPPPADAGPVADMPPTVSAPTESPSLEPSLLKFRDILNMPRSEDRVQAFHQTRTQFGSIDTGLNRWIQVVVQAHPEHQDVVAQSQKQSTGEPKVVVSRGKFPKLPSLSGPFGAHGDGSPGGSGHARRPSGPILNKQQVEQRGKELLHTAGMLGGRAGQTAKGLFARGRSKLKGNGAEQ